MRKGTLWHFRANMRFLNIRVALDFKSTPLKTFLKNLDLPQSYDCFRNTKLAWVLLALWNFPCLCNCCWHLISVLLRTLFFEFFFFFFFDRPLAANASLCQCTGALSPLKPELYRKDSSGWLMTCRANWQSQRVRYFLRPTKLRWSRKEKLAGKAPRPRGGFTRKHDQRGPNGQLPLRDHVQSASPLSALKKVWSPTCPLNGSFQSPNCPLEGMFHSPNGIF